MQSMIPKRFRSVPGPDRTSNARGRRYRLSVESLETRLAPAGLINGDFSISDPADPNYGWTTRGAASIANGQGILDEGTTVRTEFSQTFTIAPGTTALRFTIVASNLVTNGGANPPDAFEAALLDAQTNLPLVGPVTGLTGTDAFLNLQQTGQVYYAPQVSVPGAGASGAVATLGYPELITIDVSSVPANTQATLYFDLIGFSPATSSVRITNVTALQGAAAPPVAFTLDTATDSGPLGDDLTNFNPVSFAGVTDPGQTVDLAIGQGEFTAGTTTADAAGHFAFTGVALTEGANLVRVRATNAQGSTIASRTITVDTQRPTGALASPAPGSTATADLGYVDVQWSSPGSAAIDPTTFGIGDVTITGVTVDAVQDLGNNLQRYQYNLDGDTLPVGTINVGLVAGQVADLAGNVNVQETPSFLFQPVTVLAPAANAQSVTTAQATAKAITLTGSDPNTPPLPLGFAVTVSPSHGVLSGTAPNLTYTPAAGYFGADSFQFTVANGSLTSTPATVSITVVGKPTAGAQSVTTTQDGPRTIALTGTDPNTPALPLTFTVTTQPLHGSLSGDAPNLTYTPAAGYFGADSFRFTTGNGTTTSDPATVSITVVGRPTAVSRTVIAHEAISAAFTLAGTDPNTPPLPLTYVVTAGPTHGRLSGEAPNLTYTPDVGFSGSDAFRFKVSNGTLESPDATVSITVIPTGGPVELPPVAKDDSYTTAQGQPLDLSAPGVLANDTTPGPELTALLVDRPSHGTLVLHADGSFQYTPDAAFSGVDGFSYRAVAGAVQGNVATVHLTVTPTPPPPPPPPPTQPPTRLLPDTPYYNHLRQRRSLNPSRFDTYHPQVGALLALEVDGVPTSPRVLVARNARFNAPAERLHFQRNPEQYGVRQPVLGALFRLERPLTGPPPIRLLPSTRHFDALRTLYGQSPAKFQGKNAEIGAILALETLANRGRPAAETTASD